MKTQIFTLLFVLAIVKTFSQTGPGGVGSSSDIAFWLSAGENTSTSTDNSYLESWNDKYGNISAKKSGNADKPKFRNASSFSMNGYPVICFDGNSDRLKIGNHNKINTANSGYLERTFSIVLKTSDEIIAKQLIYEEGGKSNGFSIYISNGKLYINAYKGNSYHVNCSGTVAASTPYIITGTFNANSNEFSLYLNGTLAQTVTGISKMPAHSGGIGMGRIDGKTVFHDNVVGRGESASHNGRDFKGDIVEFIIYNTALNMAKRVITENYLSSKFNIVIDSSVAKNIMSSAMYGDFDFDVIGLGQASNGSNHKDSQGSGMLRINNPDDLGNDEFIFLGHNNGAIGSYGVSDIPNGIEARISRVWKLAETGDVGNVDLLFDLSSFGSVDASDLNLLIDNNMDGFFADENNVSRPNRSTRSIFSGAISMGNGQFKFVGVNIQNGQSFTIGSSNAFNTALPINLLDFKAIVVNNNVELNWVTATEINNNFFTIERSLNTKIWEVVNVVEGAGNSISLKNYSTTDNISFNGLVYYRLKQTDFDGSSTYSKIIAIDLSSKKETQFVYNRNNEELQIIGLELDETNNIEMRLYNFNGQLIDIQKADKENDSVSFKTSGFKGAFIIQLLQDNTVVVKKVIL